MKRLLSLCCVPLLLIFFTQSFALHTDKYHDPKTTKLYDICDQHYSSCVSYTCLRRMNIRGENCVKYCHRVYLGYCKTYGLKHFRRQ